MWLNKRSNDGDFNLEKIEEGNKSNKIKKKFHVEHKPGNKRRKDLKEN